MSVSFQAMQHIREGGTIATCLFYLTFAIFIVTIHIHARNAL